MSKKSEVIARLLEAEEEAKRFSLRCRTAIESVDTAGKEYYQNRDFAAAKRASLDLSRSLSKLRSSLYK